MFNSLKQLLNATDKGTFYSCFSSLETAELEKVSLEEEVIDTTINGHDDGNGGDDATEIFDEPQGSNPVDVGSKKSLVHHIPYDDVPKLEFCLASTETLLDLLKQLHGPACKRSECNRQLQFRKSFVGTCLVVNWSCGAGLFGGRYINIIP